MKKCFECEAIEDLQEHHVVPRSRGGTRTVTLCYQCHMKAHGRSAKGSNHKHLTKVALAEKKKQGFKLGNAPYGYKHSKDRKSYIVHEEEHKVILLVNDMRNNKKPWKEIIKTLNDNNIKTRRGKPWNTSTSHNMLNKAIQQYKEENTRAISQKKEKRQW